MLGSSRSLPRSGSAVAAGPGARQLRTFEADERSTTSGCGGRARYMEAAWRRRLEEAAAAREAALAEIMAEAEQGSDRRPKFLARRGGKLRSAARPDWGGRARAWTAPRSQRLGKGGDQNSAPRRASVRQRGSGAASSGAGGRAPRPAGVLPPLSGTSSRATPAGLASGGKMIDTRVSVKVYTSTRTGSGTTGHRTWSSATWSA